MKEGEGMLDTETHDLIHILANVEKNVIEQARLHSENVKWLRKANELIDEKVKNGRI